MCLFILIFVSNLGYKKSMIKAVFFDIDGTLVSFKTHEVPQSTIEALDLLRKKGIKVFIATGRHYTSINNLGDLKFDGYVTLNGGYCFAGEDKVIYKHSIPDRDIEALIRYMETEESFPCAFVQEKEIFMNYKDETVEEIFNMLNFPEPPIRPMDEIRGKTAYQLVSFFTAEQEKKIMTILSNCESTRWNPLFTDVVPAGSSKRVGIDKMLEYFRIPLNECMAFGDGGNDVAMLQHAGIGVAMGNAEDDVKQYADYITDSVDEDGIFKALKHLNII
ncbi:cof-like hydrolase [Parabacteroides sp. HGS0025]|jgi:Cof subfamily protein (haloacid dehalogenase superfamily)|uniref:Cof-like hydrolase n=2 Tax=Tannerellaceae TaxID=2005525 RepID=A0A0F5IPE2_9BACT|nr:cof-like hydrolase [Parabacteroides gordonii MS-1 = DSM 23371]KKB49770.1 cof-like hydrolase [Parabacteroides sp. HGS0025]